MPSGTRNATLPAVSRPRTAPVNGRLTHKDPFFNNDLAPGKVTGEAAGRYTFDLARTYHSGTGQSRAPSRPGTASRRRRYFFPQEIVQKNTTKKQQIPFYQYYDVMQETTNNNDPKRVMNFDAKTRNSTKFYYRDYAQSDVEHYAQNRHEAPLKVNTEELREWLVTARPRSSTDAGPMLVLCQNIMKSLLEEKSIVFEQRAQVEKDEKEAAVSGMSKRIKELEEELKHMRNRVHLAESKAVEFKAKYNAALDRADELQKDMEQANEVIAIKEKKMKGFNNVEAQNNLEKELYTSQIDGLRKWSALCIRELRSALISAQDGAMVCSAMELIGPGAGTPRTDTLLGATALADMLPSDPQSFKIPNAPAHDLQPLKLEPRIQSMQAVIFAMATQLLTCASDLHVANKQLGVLKAQKQVKFPTPLVLDSDFIVARNELLQNRQQIRDLRTFTVEPKHILVVKAFLLLMGIPNKKIGKWADMKKQLGPELFRHVLLLDTETVKFGNLLKESWFLIEGLAEADVVANSEAVGCLYKVVKGLVTAKASKDSKPNSSEPAGEAT